MKNAKDKKVKQDNTQNGASNAKTNKKDRLVKALRENLLRRKEAVKPDNQPKQQ